MFSTCLFCRADLGRNDQLETLPIGRRIAFDPAKGRLWVVCLWCKRWSLSPLEERWEAIEASERIVRELRPIMASDRISLYRHGSGLDLVRLGGPTWREEAYWRYGPRLNRRRLLAQARHGASVATAAAVPLIVGLTILPGVGGVYLGIGTLALAKTIWNTHVGSRPAVRVGEEDFPIVIRRKHLSTAELLAARGPEPWSLSVASDNGVMELRGGDALRVLGRALVDRNTAGAGREDLRHAVVRIEASGSAERFLESVLQRLGSRWRRPLAVLPGRETGSYSGPLVHLPAPTRIALEIVAHEEIERRALEGELATLELMWREAEEIAAIADNLLVPPAVTAAWRRLRGGL